MSSAKLLYKQINKLDPKQVSKKLKEFLKEDVPAGDATTKNIVLIAVSYTHLTLPTKRIV